MIKSLKHEYQYMHQPTPYQFTDSSGKYRLLFLVVSIHKLMIRGIVIHDYLGFPKKYNLITVQDGTNCRNVLPTV